MVPIYSGVILWNMKALENLMENMASIKTQKGSSTHTVSLAYLMGAPFAVFLLFLMIAVPLESPVDPNHAGEKIVYSMLYSQADCSSGGACRD